MLNKAPAIFLLALAFNVSAADVPPSSAALRAQITKEYMSVCVKSIEEKPDLRAIYSTRTIETYCACRQRYRADVLAQAIKNNERGTSVADRASDYAQEKCSYILLQSLEEE